MSIPSTIESLSTTPASNGPSGSDQRTLADDGLRQAYAFIKMLKVSATIASANTVTPPSTANVFSVTGVTTINTIASTNSWDGRDIWFIFAGAMQLTHSSNLDLPGAANITTAVGDTACFIQTGTGAWICALYQRGDGSLIANTGVNLTLTGNLSVQGNTTLGNAGTDTVTTNGNVTFNTPTAGVHTINTLVSTLGLTVTDGTRTFAVTSSAGGSGVNYFGSSSNHAAGIITNNTERLLVSAAGNMTGNAPTSGRTLALTAFAGAAGLSVVSAAAQSAYCAYSLNGTDAAFTSATGAAAQIVNDTATGDYAIRIEGHDFRVCTNSGASSALVVTSDGRWYGKFLHNNAGSVTGTTNQYVGSGTYTPTLTNVANTAARTANANTTWLRVGNVVTVSGLISIDPTVASTLTRVGISLPIASNLGANDLGGTASRATTVPINGYVAADSTNDRAELGFFCDTDPADSNWVFSFQYTVI